MGTCPGLTLSGLLVEGFVWPLKKACAKYSTGPFTKSTAGASYFPWRKPFPAAIAQCAIDRLRGRGTGPQQQQPDKQKESLLLPPSFVLTQTHVIQGLGGGRSRASLARRPDHQFL